jgi:hypothetical protein
MIIAGDFTIAATRRHPRLWETCAQFVTTIVASVAAALVRAQASHKFARAA